MADAQTETQVVGTQVPVRPTWQSVRFKDLIMIDRLSLIDESANFSFQPYIIKDHLRYLTHYCGEVEFVLLKYFCEPRSREDVEAYFASELPGELSDPGLITKPLSEYMDDLLAIGVLTEGGMKHDMIKRSKGSQTIVFTAPPIQKHAKTVHSFPNTIGLNLTERCNLACLHCSVGSNPSVSTKNDLTKEELHDFFDQCDAAGLETLRLTGGEPMIRPDFWEILEDASTHRRFSLVLFTNGTRVTAANVGRLVAIKRRMGSRFLIHISLDGGTAPSHDFLRNSKGNFNRVVQTMKLLHDNGVHFYIESVLHKLSATAEEVESLCATVAPFGVTYIALHPGEMIGTGENEQTLFFTREFLVKFGQDIQPTIDKWKAQGVEISFSSYTFPLTDPTIEDRREREAELRRRNGPKEPATPVQPIGADGGKSFKAKIEASRKSGFNVCTAAISQAALGADGSVYGCPRYVGAKRYVMGNVRDRSMLQIWGDPGWDFLRENYQPKLKLCNRCNFYDNCFYGKTCRANPGYLFNDAYGVSPECIVEYDKLGLPYEKVKGYLQDRKADNPDDSRVQALCDRLLRMIAEKQASISTSTIQPSAGPALG